MANSMARKRSPKKQTAAKRATTSVVRARFVVKLREHLRFVLASCGAYDAGDESEALRIAVSLRVLFHDTANSTSLASHLDMKDWKILSSPRTSLGGHTAFVKIKMNFASSTPMRALPLLGRRFESVPLDTWWRGRTVYSFEQREYCRHDLVLAAANKDGGAHVDAKLERFYEDLASGIRSLGLDGKNLQYNGAAPFDRSQIQYPQNLHQAMIRQFGHEVLASAKHFDWLGRLNA